MSRNKWIMGAAVITVLSFFGIPTTALAQGLGYYPGYRMGFYGAGYSGYYGGGYGAGYFGRYRAGYYGASPYGASIYGGSYTGAGFLGTSPYLTGYGLYAPYAHAYPTAPYSGSYGPYSSPLEYGNSPYPPTLPNFDLRYSRGATPRVDERGHVVVRLPRANAQLLINGNKTRQKGKTRRFVSDPIRKGRSETYTFTARWKEKGTEVERTKKIALRAGEDKVVKFANSSGNKNKAD
jgi:uncharacterized protein (TIGR03000 family)